MPNLTPGDTVRLLRDVLKSDAFTSLYNMPPHLVASAGETGTVDTWLKRNRLLIMIDGVPVEVHRDDLELVAPEPLGKCNWCNEPVYNLEGEFVAVTSLSTGTGYYVHPGCAEPWRRENADRYREQSGGE